MDELNDNGGKEDDHADEKGSMRRETWAQRNHDNRRAPSEQQRKHDQAPNELQ